MGVGNLGPEFFSLDPGPSAGGFGGGLVVGNHGLLVGRHGVGAQSLAAGNAGQELFVVLAVFGAYALDQARGDQAHVWRGLSNFGA